MSEKEPMPSPEINPGNCLARVQECMKYMALQKWSHFNFLYSKLAAFQDIRVKGAGKMLRDDDEFTCAWNNLRSNSVDSMLKNLESAQSFQEFQEWMKRLSEIVVDPRSLWNILHTEVQASLKVTLEQSQQIASAFFSPEMLFEFGLDSFLKSSLCNFKDIKNEEQLIDIFYGTAGYVRACNLPTNYEVKAPHYIEMVHRILKEFVTLPDFDAHKFIWLVEVIHDNLCISETTLRQICEKVLQDFSTKDSAQKPLPRLHKMCIISTSPFLQKLSMLQEAIDQVFKNVIAEQHKFIHRYIFGCFVNIKWEGEEIGDFSEPLIEWKLYLENLDLRIKAKPELPNLLLVDLIDDSLSYFTGYYGEVQPSQGRSKDLRKDIFEIVDLSSAFYPGTMSEDTLKKLWYLLYIVAVSGAQDDQLKNVTHSDCKEKNQPFLGLAHTENEFKDYVMALSRISFKFSSEFEAFPAMVDFVRKNYN